MIARRSSSLRTAVQCLDEVVLGGRTRPLMELGAVLYLPATLLHFPAPSSLSFHPPHQYQYLLLSRTSKAAVVPTTRTPFPFSKSRTMSLKRFVMRFALSPSTPQCAALPLAPACQRGKRGPIRNFSHIPPSCPDHPSLRLPMRRSYLHPPLVHRPILRQLGTVHRVSRDFDEHRKNRGGDLDLDFLIMTLKSPAFVYLYTLL